MMLLPCIRKKKSWIRIRERLFQHPVKTAIRFSPVNKMSNNEKIILFSRFPVPGKTKTRLIPALGPYRAAELQKWMSERMATRAAAAARGRQAAFEVRFTDAKPEQMRQWLGEEAAYAGQGPGDIGARLKLAFADAFAAGFARVVVIGADCPDLAETHIIRALELLEKNDLVLGPCADGGYCLIALTAPAPALFNAVPWGGGKVTAHTIEQAAALGLSTTLLEELRDVDRPEDLDLIDNYPLP